METLNELRDRVARARQAITGNGDVDTYDQGVADGLSVALVYLDHAIARQLRDLAAEAADVFGTMT